MIPTLWRQFSSALYHITLVSIVLTCPVGASAADFVRTMGNTFALSGKPFFVTGVNNHYLPHASKVEITRVLDDAVSLGTPVFRLYLEPVIGSPDGKNPTIWKWRSTANSSDLGAKGRYLLYWDDTNNRMAINDGPDGMQKIDYIIAQAQKRNIRLIIAFLDFWDYTGGAQQMRSWYGSSDKYTFFFSDPRTKLDYKEWVGYVVNRYNKKTKLHYRDDPTIMAWELMNEPNAKPAQLLDAWVSEMSSYIKSIDQNHLVGTGSANADFRHFDIITDLKTNTVDYGTWHGYPKYFQVSAEEMNDLIPRYCALGRAYQKPVLLEEFGYARSNPDQITEYTKWLNTLTADPNCAGWAIWRLVSRQDDGAYPVDDYDQFDIHNDGGPLWNSLKAAVQHGIERNHD